MHGDTVLLVDGVNPARNTHAHQLRSDCAAKSVLPGTAHVDFTHICGRGDATRTASAGNRSVSRIANMPQPNVKKLHGTIAAYAAGGSLATMRDAHQHRT